MKPNRKNYNTRNNWWQANKRYWLRKVKEAGGGIDPEPEPDYVSDPASKVLGFKASGSNYNAIVENDIFGVSQFHCIAGSNKRLERYHVSQTVMQFQTNAHTKETVLAAKLITEYISIPSAQDFTIIMVEDVVGDIIKFVTKTKAKASRVLGTFTATPGDMVMEVDLDIPEDTIPKLMTIAIVPSVYLTDTLPELTDPAEVEFQPYFSLELLVTPDYNERIIIPKYAQGGVRSGSFTGYTNAYNGDEISEYTDDVMVGVWTDGGDPGSAEYSCFQQGYKFDLTLLRNREIVALEFHTEASDDGVEIFAVQSWWEDSVTEGFVPTSDLPNRRILGSGLTEPSFPNGKGLVINLPTDLDTATDLGLMLMFKKQVENVSPHVDDDDLYYLGWNMGYLRAVVKRKDKLPPEPESTVRFASNVFELPNFQLTPINTANSLYRYNRWRISVGAWPVRGAQFLISNINVLQNRVINNTDPITFEGLFLEIVGSGPSPIVPITVNGQAEFTIPPGGYVWTDPMDVTIPTDAPLYLRSARRFTLGQTWTGTSALISTQIGDFAQHSGTSLLEVAAGRAPQGTIQQYSPRPPIIAMVGLGTKGNTPIPLVLGSSGAYGVGWNTRLTASRREVGYMRNAFGAPRNGRTTSMFAATSGGTTANTVSYLLPYLSGAFAELPNLPFNCVYNQLGLNDLGTFAQAKAQVENLRYFLDNTFGKVPFIMQTLTPTTSKVNPTYWTDENNQGFSTPAFGPDPSARSDFNDWIRSGPNDLFCVDAATFISGQSSSKIATRWEFQTVLTEAVTVGATSLKVESPPPIGSIVVLRNGTTFDKGSSERMVVGKITDNGTYFTIDLLGGDYTALGEGAVSKDMPVNTEVLITNTYDGLHFSTEAQRNMAQPLIQVLNTLPFKRIT